MFKNMTHFWIGLGISVAVISGVTVGLVYYDKNKKKTGGK